MSGLFAGIELGGTKTIVVLGEPGVMRERVEFPTTTPEETLSHAAETIEGWQGRAALRAVGVASFGPIRVAADAPDFGVMLDTPKPGWRGARVAAYLAGRLGLPLMLDTDVNAAALAEHAFGAGQGCSLVVYLTIGTGLGGGIVVNGLPVHGMMHPEIGHVRLRRAPGDAFAGACRFHGDCAEGLLSGPALAARFGRHPAHVAPGSPEWAPVAHDLAELLGMLVVMLSPQRVIVGGGVANKQPHLLPAALARLPDILGGYLRDCTPDRLARMIVPPQWGDDAGPMGSLVLAGRVRVAQH